MCIEDIEIDLREYEEREKERERHRKCRESVRREQEHLKELRSKVWWAVEDRGSHLSRCYVSRGKGYVRKESNKRVRRAREVGQRGDYRKLYDYWWVLF